MKAIRFLPGLMAVMVLFCLNEVTGQWLFNGNHIYNTNSQNVGIGTGGLWTPTEKLHINNGTTPARILVEMSYGGSTGMQAISSLRLQNSATGDLYQAILRKNNASHQMVQSCYDASAGAWREFNFFDFATRKYEMRAGILDAEFLNAGNFLINNNGNVGIHTLTPQADLEVYTDSYTYSRLGYLPGTCNYFVHNEISADGDGQSTATFYRTSSVASDGVGYSVSGANCALKGYNYDGDDYTFGTTGYCYLDNPRTGGVFGGSAGATWWGALGYRDSGGNYNGGYFTSYSTGSGKSSTPAHIAKGIAVWGDLFGADIHGKIYGVYAEGENYALYSHGTTYKDALDVHLQESNGTNTVMYTHVSTDATVQTSGIATLSSGKASIVFDPVFSSVVSAAEPVIVTVTPLGRSNGVYLSDVTSNGFTVNENNDGKSNITVNYIAIGKRTGYEDPQLAKEVIGTDYVNKLSRGLHNDNDTSTDGEGLYYENGQLIVGQHPGGNPEKKIPQLKEATHITSDSGLDKTSY